MARLQVMIICVTTMLNFFTTSNGFRSTLPVVSNLTAMNVWDGVCMCFIYASLLEFIAVNYVGRKRPKENSVYHPGENTLIQGSTYKALLSPVIHTLPNKVFNFRTAKVQTGVTRLHLESYSERH
ncbi:hypothetical protein QYM36_017379 [Artemia franciscana]|uniref:Neurotransmitter-gated ion-channel transmembrane domain-containing protein n=1 Tax=Artemia franciscana TaxID=6661 RepID=A0AA88L2G0_ARTSF|nr:hypothetical protein QYM36_017379 [Artemia franciscana]